MRKDACTENGFFLKNPTWESSATPPPQIWTCPDANVGIGEYFPTKKLDVRGTGRFWASEGSFALIAGSENNEGFFVDDQGFTGIGEPNPEEQLHVGDKALFESQVEFKEDIKIKGDPDAKLITEAHDAKASFGIIDNYGVRIGSQEKKHSSGHRDLLFTTDDDDIRMRLTGKNENNENHGRLHLGHHDQGDASPSQDLFFNPRAGGSSHYSWMTDENDAGVYWDPENGDRGLTIAPVEGDWHGLRVTGDGNVGIGTRLSDNPDEHQLAVNGTIGANEIIVESEDWYDRVLKEDYPLRPLEDFAGFISQNHHLPHIPSEEEVLEEGIALGKMQGLLLKQLEEQALYILELNKEKQEAQNELEALESEMEQLEARIEALEGNE